MVTIYLIIYFIHFESYIIIIKTFNIYIIFYDKLNKFYKFYLIPHIYIILFALPFEI